MRSGPTADVNNLTLPAQPRKRDDPALATTSRFAEPVDDTDRITLSCATRHASTAESNCACARSPSVEPCPHPQSQSERRTHSLWLTVSPRATDKPVPTMRAETAVHARARSPLSPLFPNMTDPGATGTCSRPTPPENTLLALWVYPLCPSPCCLDGQTHAFTVVANSAE